MRIQLITPFARGSTRGNGVTARRWARIFGELGHEAEILERFAEAPCDVLVGLHARRSHDSIVRFAAEPDRGALIVALTGTDIYGDLPASEAARESLELADRIVVLQDHARGEVEEALRPKVRVVLQSAEALAEPPAKRAGVFSVAVVGHLREVKDPFRAAEAVRDLPAGSRIEVVHVGAALEPGMAERAAAEMKANARYRWLGAVSQLEAKRVIACTDLMAVSSRSEGGPSVISEAIVAGTPIVSSRMGGAIGTLGADYPGYFEVADTAGLRALLLRCERDSVFLNALRARGEGIRPSFAPAAERAAWREVLAGL